MIGREAIASEVRRARYTATATRRPVYASTCWPDKTTRISAVSTSMTGPANDRSPLPFVSTGRWSWAMTNITSLLAAGLPSAIQGTKRPTLT